jgi:gluconate 2-dehydrogenase gamma chain
VANQSPDRRQVLAMLARVAAVSGFPGFCTWAAAAEPAAPRESAYHPQFFTPQEFKTIDVLTELIIPRDESPGARDAGVSEFVDFMVSQDEDLQYPFRTGLTWLDTFATEKYGSDFSALGGNEQESLLKKLAYRNQHSPLEEQGQEFFKRIREYTVLGYYTSRVGLEQLDYPGLKFYRASPECPHTDDPEHLHLPAAKL